VRLRDHSFDHTYVWNHISKRINLTCLGYFIIIPIYPRLMKTTTSASFSISSLRSWSHDPIPLLAPGLFEAACLCQRFKSAPTRPYHTLALSKAPQ
jgi:hypothetical protein